MRNWIKVMIGFWAGFIIRPLYGWVPYWMFCIVSMVFYSILYALLDRIKRYIEVKWLPVFVEKGKKRKPVIIIWQKKRIIFYRLNGWKFIKDIYEVIK